MVTVRVASFNVRTSTGRDGRNGWLWRRRACLAAVRALDADVVGLQEVRGGQLRSLRRAFGDGTVVGEGRVADGGGARAAVLVRGPWQVIGARTRWLSPTPDVPGSTGWGAHHPRIVTLVRLERDGRHLGVANTHLDHASRPARERGAELVAGWLRDEPDLPWVITGDLNVPAESAPVRTLLEAGFTDALHGVPGGTFHAFAGGLDGPRIDYVLAGPGVTVREARIVTTPAGERLPSDHWPVVVDLEVPG